MKLTITRTELKKIFDVACETWQPRIEKYAQRNPFGDTIDFSEKEINEMIKACTAEQLPLVKRIFDIVDSFEKINSVEDACAYLGESDKEVIELRTLQSIKISDRILAQQEAVCFVRALNEKFEFDWKNSSQEKYRIWWYMDSFRFYDSDWYVSYSFVPASLCFVGDNAEKNIKEAVVEFKEEFRLSRTTLL